MCFSRIISLTNSFRIAVLFLSSQAASFSMLSIPEVSIESAYFISYGTVGGLGIVFFFMWLFGFLPLSSSSICFACYSKMALFFSMILSFVDKVLFIFASLYYNTLPKLSITLVSYCSFVSYV